jgi:TatD DNase family protein
MPQDRILTESDGPFARMDGAPVLPWQVDKAVRILSGLWGVSPAEAEQITHCNLRTLTTFVPSALQ